MYCNNCGKAIDDNSMYCGICGAPVSGKTQVQAQAQTQTSTSSDVNPVYHNNSEYNNNPSNNEKAEKNRNILIDRIKKIRTFSTIAAVMSIISQVGGGILSLIFINNEGDDAAPTMLGLFVLLLVINVPSFIYFTSISRKTNKLLNVIEMNYNRQQIFNYFSTVKKSAAIIIMLINIVFLPGFITLPLGIFQVITCISILNLRNFFQTNQQFI
ncbi:MAG: zinc ribbon domain-containing protein [Eubacterium sp.]|nr:zinc ribbon domain-containing protein [Eubacterium sp.]